MKKIISLLYLLVVGNAYGADWVYIAATPHGSYFYDASTMRHNKNDQTTVVRIAIKKLKQKEFSHFIHSTTKHKIYCDSMSIQTFETIIYNEKAEQIDAYYSDKPFVIPIGPNSIKEEIYKVGCM